MINNNFEMRVISAIDDAMKDGIDYTYVTTALRVYIDYVNRVRDRKQRDNDKKMRVLEAFGWKLDVNEWRLYYNADTCYLVANNVDDAYRACGGGQFDKFGRAARAAGWKRILNERSSTGGFWLKRGVLDLPYTSIEALWYDGVKTEDLHGMGIDG